MGMKHIYTYFLRFIFLLTIIIYAFDSNAQQSSEGAVLQFEKVGENVGITQNSILDIFQDSKGYLWFSTPNGLFRFDGYDTKVFNSLEGEGKSLAYNEVKKVREGADGTLWILNLQHINALNPRTGKIQNFNLDDLKYIRLRHVVPDKSKPNHVWISTNKNIGLLIFDEKLEKLETIHYPLIDDPSIDAVRYIYQDQKENLWCAVNSSLVKVKYDNGTFDITQSKKNGNVSYITEDSKGQLYASLAQSIVPIEEKEDEISYTKGKIPFSKDLANSEMIRCILPFKNKLWLIGGKQSLVEHNPDKNAYTLHESSENFVAPKGTSIGSAFIDRSGILWLGTYRTGLYRCNLYPKQFNTLSAKNGLTDNFINQIVGDNQGNLWTGTYYGGVNQIKKENHSLEVSPFFNQKAGLKDKMVSFAVTYDNKNTLWMSAFKRGVSRIWLDENKKPLKRDFYPFMKENGIPTVDVSIAYTDKKGKVWMASNMRKAGLIRVDENADGVSFTRFEDNILKQANIYGLFRDNKDNLWVSINNGTLFRFKLDKNHQPIEKERVLDKNDTFKTLEKYRAFSFIQDKDENLWIGTFGGGLVKVTHPNNTSKRQFEYFTKREGLSNNTVYAVLQDKQENIWVSTDEGISCLNPKNKIIHTYNVKDGLQDNNFRKWSGWKDNDGTLYFGGINGITYFNPAEIENNSFTPQPSITKFSVVGKEASLDSYIQKAKVDITNPSTAQQLVLSANQNSISFEFSSMQFDNPDKCKYKYKLEGVQDEWIEVNAKHRSATYSYLPKGEYVFKLMSTNGDGVWGEEYLYVPIEVLPYWYETTLAYVIYIIAFFSGLYWVISFQKRRQAWKNQLEIEKIEREKVEELNKVKLSFFTNISHELKTPLTIISGIVEQNMTLALQNNMGKQFSIIQKNGGRMLRLVQQLLDFRKVESGHTPLKLVSSDVVGFCKEISQIFSSYAETQNLQLKFSSNFKEQEVVFDPDKLEKVISNLLDNAIKYTQESGSSIELLVDTFNKNDLPVYIDKSDDVDNNYLVIKVKDDGIGLPEGSERSIFTRFFQVKDSVEYTNVQDGVGIGLAYCKILVELHNGYIYAEPLEKGTCFNVVLPIDNQTTEKVSTSNKAVDKVLESTRAKFELDKGEEVITTTEKRVLNGNVKFFDNDILIVEDNEDIRGFLKEFLSPVYKVHEAENGQQGFDMAKEIIPDLIISDVSMPLMDGYELCNQIKNDIKTNHIPVILLTANGELEHRIEGLKAGADSYIPKPFNLEHLQIRIEKLLELRGELKKKYLSLQGQKEFVEADFNEPDKEFIKAFEDYIEENLSNSELSVTDLEEALGFSKMQLFRKVKSLTGLSSVEFIRDYRLRRAIDMMHSTNLKVTEIVYSVGFTGASYFGKCFKKKYDKTPSEFLKEVRNS